MATLHKMTARLGDETGFGALWVPRRALAELRARATRHGAALVPVECLDDVDILASVITVDAWMFALDATDLELPSRYGAAAVAVLARSLARAAGSTAPHAPADLDAAPTGEFLARAEAYAEWVREQGQEAFDVLSVAAMDVSCGSGEPRLAQMAAALQLCAETTE